jgi:peptidyl-prolyl cis-trans isomerase D
VQSSSLGYGEAAQKAVETLEVGKLSDVLQVPGGYLIVKVDERLEAGPSFDQVKMDFAWSEALPSKAKELAKADAEAALAAAKAGTPLEDLFAKAEPADAKPAEEKPAAAGAPVPPAKPAAAPGKKFDKVKLSQAGKIRRAGKRLNGDGPDGYLGESEELAKAIFDEVAVGQLAPKVYETEAGFVLFKVVEKEEPDMVAFETEKADLGEALAGSKADGVLREWKQKRCETLRNAGKIEVTPAFVEYGELDEKGQAKKSNYQPCAVAARTGLPPGFQLPEGVELPEGFTFE